jgi:hypothetical protein
MVGPVVVDRARGDRPRSGEGERRERLRVVERGNLGDHPADADARQVRRPVIELAGECRSVGCKITQRVRRRLGIDGDRRTGIAQVIAHDVTPAARERFAECVGPGGHGRATRAQNERRRRVAVREENRTLMTSSEDRERTEQLISGVVDAGCRGRVAGSCRC